MIRLLFNSLARGKFEWNYRHAIFKQILVIDDWGISCEIALLWMSRDLTGDKSTLVQVMACCLTAPSHYLNQCWLRSLSPHGVTGPQWVKAFKLWIELTWYFWCYLTPWIHSFTRCYKRLGTSTACIIISISRVWCIVVFLMWHELALTYKIIRTLRNIACSWAKL